jgi:hypothetical protein
MKVLPIVAAVLMLVAYPAFAQKKDCNELKTEIEAKIKANGAQMLGTQGRSRAASAGLLPVPKDRRWVSSNA